MYIYEIMDYSTDIAFVSGISDLYMKLSQSNKKDNKSIFKI